MNAKGHTAIPGLLRGSPPQQGGTVMKCADWSQMAWVQILALPLSFGSSSKTLGYYVLQFSQMEYGDGDN